MGEPTESTGETLARDPDAFARIVDRSGPRLRRLLSRLSHSGSDVDDLVQETYLRAWRGFGRFRNESRVLTWMTRIAINVSRTHARSGSKTVSLSVEAAELATAVPGLDEPALRSAYEQALARLSPEQRAVFLRHEAEGQSYQQIAEALGCPLGTVMSRLHRARAQLLEELRERVEECVP